MKYTTQLLGLGLWCACLHSAASDLDEFKVKRKEVFEFTEKPKVMRSGDRTEIIFGSKDYCDATVAIENMDGRIVRHLASGVLGPRAPEPFQRNALEQHLVWDGKDDQGKYRDDQNQLIVRVSLGLQPRFERTLFWSPYKRIGEAAPLIQADPDGVYVYDAFGRDLIQAYDHDGKYLRTVYPFPAPKLESVKGLDWQDFPHGFRLPLKQGLYQHTLFTSGNNSCMNNKAMAMDGTAASTMAVRDGKLALAKDKLNRMATDGSSGGLVLAGGKTSVTLNGFYEMYHTHPTVEITPTSAALSPDGQWLYLAGYSYRYTYNYDTLHVVTRIPYATDGPAQVFAGAVALKEGYAAGEGTEPGKFQNATSVDCDALGRVYVSDLMNDRIQVFTPEGKHLKNIPVNKPALVRVNRRTGELFVFSWAVPTRLGAAKQLGITPTLTRLGAFDNPQVKVKYDLPLPGRMTSSVGFTELDHAMYFKGEVDSWAEPLTVWLSTDCVNSVERGLHRDNGGRADSWEATGLCVLREKEGKLQIMRDFGKETVREVARARPPPNVLQKFCFNPKTQKLYLHEGDCGHYTQCVKQLMELDVETGKVAFVEPPFAAQDVAFDLDGFAYLRTKDVIVRYDPQTKPWREVPFDYGEELAQVGEPNVYAPVLSGLVMPATYPVCAHTGGFNISPKGHILAACSYRFAGVSRDSNVDQNIISYGRKYAPPYYPGRISSSISCCLHVWDKHGKMLYEDAVPGIGQVDGVGLDRNDRIYLMATPARVLDGKKFFNEMSSTLIKFTPKSCKLVCSTLTAPVPLPERDRPNRPPDIYGGTMGDVWVEGAEWFYGSVGYAGFNDTRSGSGGCACRFSRFCLDLFARSIAPEPYQFGVAVLDSAGNLIVRIGRYGNVDDGKPLVPDGGPAQTRALGGDEVGLFHTCYTGTHTDRRIFISDSGNARILSVKLEYKAEEKIRLSEVRGRTEGKE